MSKIIFGQLGRLKKEKIRDYEALHANPWPEVLKTIRDCNMRNYSISATRIWFLPISNM